MADEARKASRAVIRKRRWQAGRGVNRRKRLNEWNEVVEVGRKIGGFLRKGEEGGYPEQEIKRDARAGGKNWLCPVQKEIEAGRWELIEGEEDAGDWDSFNVPFGVFFLVETAFKIFNNASNHWVFLNASNNLLGET